MMIQLERMNGKVRVTKGGSSTRGETYPSAMIHGCDTTVPGRGKLAVRGVQQTWTDDQGRLHLSDDKKAGSDPMGGFDGFF